MKAILLLLCFIFIGCSAGPTFYGPVSQADGSVKMAPIFKLDADVEGESIEVNTSSGSLIVRGGTSVTERIILNKKGDAVLGTERTAGLAKIGVSPVVAAKGQAARGVVNSVTQGVATAIAAGAASAVVGPAAGAIK